MYRLDRLIGRGATAQVWQATDTFDARQVCVKQLHTELATDQAARTRLAAELAAARRIRHEGVLPVLDSDLDGQRPFLVFPSVEAESLGNRLARGGRLEPWQAARVAAGVASALAAVHSAGLVHRDVKPGNILLVGDESVRLLDFGISAEAGTRAALGGGAGAGRTVGTLPYIAPEQLAGEPAQPANDVFALGAVLYQAVAGRPPFEAQSAPELARAHRVAPARIADAPPTLVRIALSALELEPQARPSAHELADELQAWLSGTLHSDAPTAVVPVARAVPVYPRARGIAGLAAGLVAGLVLALVGALALAPATVPDTAALKVPQIAHVSPGPAAASGTAVEVRVPDQPTTRTDSRVSGAVTTQSQPNSDAAETKLRSSSDKPNAKPGNGKAKGEGKNNGKGKNSGKGKGRGR